MATLIVAAMVDGDSMTWERGQCEAVIGKGAGLWTRQSHLTDPAGHRRCLRKSHLCIATCKMRVGTFTNEWYRYFSSCTVSLLLRVLIYLKHVVFLIIFGFN